MPPGLASFKASNGRTLEPEDTGIYGAHLLISGHPSRMEASVRGRSIAELHGKTLWLAQRVGGRHSGNALAVNLGSHEGQGTRQAQYFAFDHGCENAMDNVESVVIDTSEFSSGVVPATSVRRLVALVVDDDPGVQEVVALILQNEGGYEVLCASNGKEALALLATVPLPDVMVVDIMMPIMDGIELLRAVQSDPRTAGIPVIVSSASTRHDLSKVRVDRLLPKPIDYDAFLEALRELTDTPASLGNAVTP